MALVSISEAARLVGISRATLYRKLKEGKVSRANGGMMDTNELLRVFGELTGDSVALGVQNEASPIQDEQLVEQLEQERKTVKELREKLDDERKMSRDREDRLLTIIENRLPAPVASETSIIKTISKSFSKLLK